MPFPPLMVMNAWTRGRGLSLRRREVRGKQPRSWWSVCRLSRETHASAGIVTALPPHDQNALGDGLFQSGGVMWEGVAG